MACSWCNTTHARVAAAIATAVEWGYADNCSDDGRFTVSGTRWPAPYHFVDVGLANFLIEIVGDSTLLDVGAGSGQYGAHFFAERSKRSGMLVPAWRGVDGASNIEEFTRTRGPPGSQVTHASLCDPMLSLPAAAWVMSLEVGEHLKSSCLETYCRLLSRTARRGLVLSWARVGQGGHCHISTRSESWVRQALGRLGWAADEPLTARARAAAQLAYLQRNVIIFRPQARKKGLRVGASSSVDRLDLT